MAQEQFNQVAILELAGKIAALLNEHPNPYEAEAACGMARELAACKVKQWPFARFAKTP